MDNVDLNKFLIVGEGKSVLSNTDIDYNSACIKISDSITAFEDPFIFSDCECLTSLVFSKNYIDSLEDVSFGNNLTSIIVPNGNLRYDSRNDCNAIIETANNSLVIGCNQTVIPNGITEIVDDAFNSCRGLRSIILPQSIKIIGSFAFSSCDNLASIIIPDNVESIGVGAFAGCNMLTTLVVSKSNSIFDSRNNCNAIIESCTNTLVVGCCNTLIPQSVEAIGDYAFVGLNGLETLFITNSVKTIGENAFIDCDNLILNNPT